MMHNQFRVALICHFLLVSAKLFQELQGTHFVPPSQKTLFTTMVKVQNNIKQLMEYHLTYSRFFL